MAVTDIMAISEFGMQYQKARVDAAATNIANANVVQPSSGPGFKPLHVAITSSFNSMLMDSNAIQTIQDQSVPDKLVYKPGHPMADQSGYVRYTNIDMAKQMISFTEATRAYEANVKAFNTQMNMMLSALEIGK